MLAVSLYGLLAREAIAASDHVTEAVTGAHLQGEGLMWKQDGGSATPEQEPEVDLGVGVSRRQRAPYSSPAAIINKTHNYIFLRQLMIVINYILLISVKSQDMSTLE